jgi:hypothetical protein
MAGLGMLEWNDSTGIEYDIFEWIIGDKKIAQ